MTDAQSAIAEDYSATFEAAAKQLKPMLGSEVLFDGDAGYEDARKIWNGMIDRRPAIIVRCAGVADVIDALDFARTRDLQVAVRGAGHNIAGTSLCEGGVVIDLSHMKGVHVDVGTRTARVQPGVTWGELDRETQRFGLAVPGGIVSTTGIAGLTLGGGFGWLSRAYGFTCDHLASADVVTADGRFVTASEEKNADLFWGIRGGGGNFGIVTSFEYRARQVGPTVLAGMVLYPMERAAEVLDFYRNFTMAAPEELASLLILRIAPASPVLPPHVRGVPVVGIAVCYAGPVERGEQLVRPLRKFGSPLVDLIGPKPFAAHQQMLDATQPPGRLYYWKSEYLPSIADEAVETICRHTRHISSPFSAVLLKHLGGAIGRVDENATAAAHRDAAYILNVAGAWQNPEESARHIRWVRELWDATRPFSTGGGYVNFLTEDEGAECVRAAYGAAKYDQLVELKDRYDPDNVFRVNQNIQPTVRGQS